MSTACSRLFLAANFTIPIKGCFCSSASPKGIIKVFELSLSAFRHLVPLLHKKSSVFFQPLRQLLVDVPPKGIIKALSFLSAP